MLTVLECLEKASDMEMRAANCPSLELRAECLDAAIRWRDLARRALIHDHVDPTDENPSTDTN